MPTERPVISYAKRIGACTLASRVTGLIRDMLLVHTFGATWVLDRFQYAFQFPHLFRRLFGEGAIAASFVPTFTRTIEHEGHESAWRLLARALALLTIALLVVIAAIETILLAIWLFVPVDGPHETEARRLVLALTGLMLPFMLTICVVAMFSSILNCVGSFIPAALTPVILNVGMIAGITWLGPTLSATEPQIQIFGVAISVLVTGAVQLLFLLPVLRRHGVRLGWRFAPRDPAVRRMLGLMAPVALGQGLLAFGVFLDAQVCLLLARRLDVSTTQGVLGTAIPHPLKEGALSVITVAQRLYQFPLGVIGISIATAALPAFSRLAARKEWSAWAGEVRAALRMTVFAGLLTGAMMVVLAAPIVRLLFEYREFSPAATERAARVLSCYGFGMWAFCAHHIILRGFYSVGDVRTPLKISCAFLPVNLALSLVLVWFDAIREAAFAVSSALTSTLVVLIGLGLLQRRTRARVVDRATLSAAGRMLVAAVGSAAGVAALRGLVMQSLPDESYFTLWQRAADTFGSLAVGCLFFLALAWVFRLPETRLLLHPRRAVSRPRE